MIHWQLIMMNLNSIWQYADVTDFKFRIFECEICYEILSVRHHMALKIRNKLAQKQSQKKSLNNNTWKVAFVRWDNSNNNFNNNNEKNVCTNACRHHEKLLWQFTVSTFDDSTVEQCRAWWLLMIMEREKKNRRIWQNRSAKWLKLITSEH